MRQKVSEYLRTTLANRAGGFLTSKYCTAGSDSVYQEIRRQRRLLRERIASLPETPPLEFEGQGIVTAGGGRHIASLWVLLWLLREQHHSRLPVEVWHLGEDDFPLHIRQHFARFQVRFVDASQHPQRFTMPEMTGWELKPFAIAHSRFREVIWIDADNDPLVDPAMLLQDPDYQSTGALFWPDIRPANPYNPIWRICGIKPSTGWEWESGLLVVDKRRHWRPLMLTLFFNSQSCFYYRYVLGDKETFHLAWRLLDQSCLLTSSPAQGAEGAYDDGEPVPYAYSALWQHDRHGNRIALHRTGSKWVTHGRNVRFNGFDLHDACIDALAELKHVWDGRLSTAPRGAVEAQDIVGGRSYAYIRTGQSERTLELRTDGRIGHGMGVQETHWRIEPDEQGPTLIISSRQADTYGLQQDPDGIWRGYGLSHEQMRVELVPLRIEDTLDPDEQKPSLLYVTPVIPSETGNGLAMRAASVLEALTAVYRVSVLILQMYPSGPGGNLPGWANERCVDMRWAPPPPEGPEGTPDSLATAAWVEGAARAYRDTPFDVIHLFRTAALPYVDHYLNRSLDRPVMWHIDLDDVESRLEPEVVPAQSESDPVASLERVRRLEEYLLTTWDRVYVCSSTDRDYLRETYPTHSADILILPNSVSIPSDVPEPPRTIPITLILVGTLGYAPNADGALWFCRDVLPVIRERTRTPIRIQIVGSGAPEEVRNLGYIPEVEYVGPVADVAQWYRQADIAIVPIRFGGGTRIKVLEALAYRRPVVSTSTGVEGLDLDHGQHLLIADRAHSFATQCLKLIESAALARSVAECGHQQVRDCYSREAVADGFIRSELAARRRESPAM